MRVYRAEQPIELTAKEISILELFLRKPGHILDRSEFWRMWGIHQDPLTNVVDVYMRRLRKKIDMPFAQPLIQTKRGIKYYLGDA